MPIGIGERRLMNVANIKLYCLDVPDTSWSFEVVSQTLHYMAWKKIVGYHFVFPPA
jgi:hypothetical protein